MELDATTAGVERGGLANMAEIRILICYVLDSVKEPVPATRLSELLHYNGLANYFEVDSAFGVLLKNGHIAAADDSEETYVITPAGHEVAETLKTSLPFTVREKACAAAVKILSTIRNRRENRVDIQECNGGYNITCSVETDGQEMMSLKLFVTDLQQAQTVKNAFIENASDVFSILVDTLTKGI